MATPNLASRGFVVVAKAAETTDTGELVAGDARELTIETFVFAELLEEILVARVPGVANATIVVVAGAAAVARTGRGRVEVAVGVVGGVVRTTVVDAGVEVITGSGNVWLAGGVTLVV